MRDLVRQIVSGYKSIKLEGQDEGCVVFTGKEPDTKQAVSIKVLPRLLGNDPQIARRFRGLSQTIRQLNHPNIASVRKVGEESGLPYLITRVIEKSHPLAMKLDQPWAMDTAADVVMQVGQALEHAYKKGIVHGTLTPDNIMIEDDGRATVTDFGLAEIQNLLGVSVKEAASPYLAPERNAGRPADARADVYSLGAILYSMLTKRNPQVIKGEVLPPSRFNPDVSAEMDAVVVKALDPDPGNRYADVRSFLAAFGAVSLAPVVERREPLTSTGRCPNCGARNQSGKFCRKCGVRLERPKAPARSPAPAPRSVLDEPIQVTQVDVQHFKVGKGVEMQATTIAKPRTVATGELLDQFPEPLEMPEIDPAGLWADASGELVIDMPEPSSMPTIDWAEIAPPMPEVPTFEDAPTVVSVEGD